MFFSQTTAKNCRKKWTRMWVDYGLGNKRRRNKHMFERNF